MISPEASMWCLGPWAIGRVHTAVDAVSAGSTPNTMVVPRRYALAGSSTPARSWLRLGLGFFSVMRRCKIFGQDTVSSADSGRCHDGTDTADAQLQISCSCPATFP